MTRFRIFAASLLAAWIALNCSIIRAAVADTSADQQWQSGPVTVRLNEVTHLDLASGLTFADAAKARRFMTKMGNPVSKKLVGIVAPAQGGWFIVLEYSSTGHVVADNNTRIDAMVMLDAVKHRNDLRNTARAAKGWPTIEIDGWSELPFYDPILHALETSLRAKSGGRKFTNHSLRLFGRRGTLEIILVGSQRLYTNVSALTDVAAGISFVPGERYEDYQAEDSIPKLSLLEALTADDPESELERAPDPEPAKPTNSQPAPLGKTTADSDASDTKATPRKPGFPQHLIIIAIVGGFLLVLIPVFIWFGQRPDKANDSGENLKAGAEANSDPVRTKYQSRRRFRLFGRLSEPGQRQVNTMYNHLVYEEVSRAVPSHQVPMFFGGMSKRQHPPTQLGTSSQGKIDSAPNENAAQAPMPISAEDYRVIETLVRALLDSPEIQIRLLRGSSPTSLANYNLTTATPEDAAAKPEPIADDYTSLTFISPRVPRQLLLARGK